MVLFPLYSSCSSPQPHQKAAQPAQLNLPRVFTFQGTESELAGLANGSAVKPTLMPAELAGALVVRGEGAAHLVAGKGIYFERSQNRNDNCAFLQFTGSGTQKLFSLRGPGEVQFTWTSRYSFANRAALLATAGTRLLYRMGFQVASSQQGTDFEVTVTVHDGRLTFIWNVGGQGNYYFSPKGQEDKLFGEGVAARVKLNWDGQGNAALSLNGQQVMASTYKRTKQRWTNTSSFSIGAQDVHNYAGGRWASDDIISDFQVFSGGPLANAAASALHIAAPADGATLSGVTRIDGQASDDIDVRLMALRVDGQEVSSLNVYPYQFIWDTRSVKDGRHTLELLATDTNGAQAKHSLTVQVANAAAAASDNQAPGVVTGLRTELISTRAIRFSWDPATDNVAAAAYRVYRNGNLLKSVAAPPANSTARGQLQDEGLTADTLYAYQVSAVDAAGNASALSAPFELRTKQRDGQLLRVGPRAAHKTPCAAILKAHAWDTVEIDAAGNGGYDGDVCAFKIDNLTIRGVNGRARIDAAGADAKGKGVWVVQGAANIVENVEISGASVRDRNGAAIRLEGNGLTLRNVYFHHNENGILGGKDSTNEILIDRSEFAYNGAGDGRSHNLYIGTANKLTLRYCYSHHANVGHLVKSRASYNNILYNRLTDEDGTASLELDLPNGGTAVVMGNIFQQSPNNQNHTLVAFGSEGLTTTVSNDLYLVHNTLVNLDPNSFSNFLSPNVAIHSLTMRDNVAIDLGRMNWVKNQAAPAGNLMLKPAQLPGMSRYDYRPRCGGGLAGVTAPVKGPDGQPLVPLYEYAHPVSGALRATAGARTLGALDCR